MRVFYRLFPLSFHPEAMPAALASECASEQGKFWQFHDGLFENNGKLSADLYKELAGKAAILFYLMIKNHPFANGNKRIAMTTLFYLLYKNHKWMHVDNQEFYNFAKWVAESNPKLKKETVAATEKFIKSYMVNI